MVVDLRQICVLVTSEPTFLHYGLEFQPARTRLQETGRPIFGHSHCARPTISGHLGKLDILHAKPEKDRTICRALGWAQGATDCEPRDDILTNFILSSDSVHADHGTS